jgi:hypothetical protein
LVERWSHHQVIPRQPVDRGSPQPVPGGEQNHGRISVQPAPRTQGSSNTFMLPRRRRLGPTQGHFKALPPLMREPLTLAPLVLEPLTFEPFTFVPLTFEPFTFVPLTLIKEPF